MLKTEMLSQFVSIHQPSDTQRKQEHRKRGNIRP